MIRQFLRVKQIADHTFLKTEKTEVLTEDLINAEKRVDLIKQSCHNTGKKIAACLQGVGSEAVASEKRMKKLPEVLLSQCMHEWSANLGDTSILGVTLNRCATIEDLLGKELLAYETKVDKMILSPIVNLLEVEFPNASRLRKQLTKLTQDMDVARTKYHTALKHAQQSNNNTVTTTSKVEILQEELEDVSMKVEQCRDNLSAELFNIISKEQDLSKLFIDWYHLQVDYHRRELAILESSLPSLDCQIEKYPYKPVFGQSLEDHLQTANRQIALVIEACVCWLLEIGMDEEGLFRIAGSTSKVKKVKSAFDAGLVHFLDDIRDPHVIAGVLKSYLRELPEPLMTFQLYNEWLSAAEIPNSDARLQTLWRVLNTLPEFNFNNLRYIIKFLAKLASNMEANKMSSHNLAIVITPNLIWIPIEQEPEHLGVTMTKTNLLSSAVDSLIEYADWFFPGDIEFFVSTPSTPQTPNGPLVFTNVESHSITNGGSGELSTTTSSSNRCHQYSSFYLEHNDVELNSTSTSPSPKSPRACHRPGKKPAPPIPGRTKPMTGRSVAQSRVPVERSHSLADVHPEKIGNDLRNKGKSCENLLDMEQNYIARNGSVENIGRKIDEYVSNSHEDLINTQHSTVKPQVRRPQALPRNAIHRPTVSPPVKPPKPNTYPKNTNKSRPPIHSTPDNIGLRTVDINDISCSFQDDTPPDSSDSKDGSPVFHPNTSVDNLDQQFKDFLSKFTGVNQVIENRNNNQNNNLENSNTQFCRRTKMNSLTEVSEDIENSNSHNRINTISEQTEQHLPIKNSDQQLSETTCNGNKSHIPDKQYCTVIHVPGADSKSDLSSSVAKDSLQLATPVASNTLNSTTQNTRL